MRLGRAGFLVLPGMLALGPGTCLTAQDDPTLVSVERLTAEGRIMEARDSLEGWLALHELSASRENQQKAIWFRALRTVDPSMAEVDLRRLVLEFPGGAYSGPALLRLGLSAEARGDLDGARSAFESLVRTYPPGPDRSRAEAWMAAHDIEPARPGSVVETAGGRGFPGPADDPTAGFEFSVQVGAFSSIEGAAAVADALQEAGFSPRLVRVPGPDLTRVRVGRYRTRDGAEAQASLLQAAGFEVTLVFDATQEEPVG